MLARSHSAELQRPRRRQPEASRNAILQAALIEFAREGLAGARVDAIAETAGVNKALLYYYFADKESLYGAILDAFFEKLVERVMDVCSRPGTAGERFLWYVRTHFDSIAESPYYARIFMSELMSASRGGSPHLDRIFAKYMQPIGTRVLGLIEEGVRRREFRTVDPNQFIPSAIGSIVHYFLTAPLREKFMPELNSNTPQALHERRAAVLDFIAAALFADREAGIKLAGKIAGQSPAALHREPAAAQKQRARRAISRRAGAATETAQPTTEAMDSATTESGGPGGYRWMNRWFPDFETAKRVLEEEAKRHPRTAKAKRPKTRDEEGDR